MVIASFPPEPLAKLDFDKGVPTEHATLVVVPMLLSSVEVVRHELEKLEIRYLANRDVNVRFGLLSDFVDATEEHLAADAELFEAARKGILALNGQYPGDPFLLFHRERVWSPTEGKWIGRERKRGKIEDLNRFLLGKGGQDILVEGKPLHCQFATSLSSIRTPSCLSPPGGV